jgi:hypothetical protein
MRKLLVVLAASSLLVACKKKAPSANFLPTGLVKTSTSIYPHIRSRTIHNFGYNAARQLTSFSFYNYDSSGGILYFDTVTYNFTVSTSTGRPTDYNLRESNTLFGINTEVHGLFYDGAGRLIKDTTLVTQFQSGDPVANYFSYPTDMIVARHYSIHAYDSVKMTYGWGASAIDTIVLRNGDFAASYQYIQNGTTWQPNGTNTVDYYSAYANPLYNPNYSNSMGAFFLDAGYFDCLSKHLPADGVTWLTDPSGRVISGYAPDGSTTTYTYQ